MNIDPRRSPLDHLDVDSLCELMRTIPDPHPMKLVGSRILGQLFLERHELQHNELDLSKAISAFHDAVRLTPENHPDKSAVLNDLGSSILMRFERLGDIKDVDEAISLYRDALRLTPARHPDMPGYLSNLGNSIRTRFEHLGDIEDVNKAISTHHDAVRLTPDGHPAKPGRLSNLGVSILTRFERFGNIKDADKAVSAHRDALRLSPEGHPDIPGYLSNLGNSILMRFEHLGDIEDIDKAISAHYDAVRLTPDGHQAKPSRLSGLGNSVLRRFERLGDIEDVDKAISAHRDAVQLTPDGHQAKPSRLSSLGSSTLRRFERLGEIEDVDNAISAHRDALRLTPDGHQAKPSRFSNLGTSILTRFERFGDIEDVDEAVSLHGDAVRLTPGGHPDKPNFLSNLGNSILARFGRLGNIEDSDKAISAHREAVRLTPDGHPDKPSRLSNLGSSVLRRFERLGDIEDVDKAISAHHEAVQLTPDSHPDKPLFLTNLGSSLLTRFGRLRDIKDVDKAISTHREAVRLTPDDSPYKPSRLSNLGNSILRRFERLGEIEDVDKAISAQRDAVRLTPDGHPEKPDLLLNLGISILTRFDRLEDVKDVDNAVSAHRDAVRLTPEGHPDRPGRLSSLGNSLFRRFQHLGDRIDIEQAILQYSSAACSSVGPASVRFRAALQWARGTSNIPGSSSLDGYRCALDLLPHVAWLGLPISERHRELTDIGNSAPEAAAAAIGYGELDIALEWLEQGRSIVWGQILQLRSPLDDLRAKDNALVFRLEQVSKELEHSRTPSRDLPVAVGVQSSMEEEAQKHRRLAAEWDTLVERVRALSGFEGFLKPKTVSELRHAARAGPVVVINIHTTRCDALVLLADLDEVVHIPLDNFSELKAQEMQKSLGVFLSAHRLRTRDLRYTILDTQSRLLDDHKRLKILLSKLWLLVVKPVLDNLAYPISRTDDPPRIWWCPTGPLAFLPLHAAGLYDTEDLESEIGDYVTSSYTPTLTALLDTPRETHPDQFQILTIAQPSTPGHTSLPYTKEEVIRIRDRARPLRVRSLEGERATVERLLEGMKECGWIHLACHGTQNARDPTKSALLLQDGRLELAEIIKMPLPHAEFAFLSACQTATGDERLSEEAVHLAAGMLLAGYRGVIATTWSIRDDIAPFVADEVYARLLENHQPDHTRAAHALRRAVRKLRKRNDVSLMSWVPFIHIGM